MAETGSLGTAWRTTSGQNREPRLCRPCRLWPQQFRARPWTRRSQSRCHLPTRRRPASARRNGAGRAFSFRSSARSIAPNRSTAASSMTRVPAPTCVWRLRLVSVSAVIEDCQRECQACATCSPPPSSAPFRHAPTTLRLLDAGPQSSRRMPDARSPSAPAHAVRPGFQGPWRIQKVQQMTEEEPRADGRTDCLHGCRPLPGSADWRRRRLWYGPPCMHPVPVALRRT